jgi:hypothetical protein
LLLADMFGYLNMASNGVLIYRPVPAKVVSAFTT